MNGLIVTQDHGNVWTWASTGFMSRFMALTQLCSLMIFMAPDATKGREDRAVQSWSHISLLATLAERILHLGPSQPCSQGHG